MEELAKLGAVVVTCARRAEALEAALAEWQAQGLQVYGCVADVSKPADRDALMAEAEKHCNGAFAAQRPPATPHRIARRPIVVLSTCVQHRRCPRALASLAEESGLIVVAQSAASVSGMRIASGAGSSRRVRSSAGGGIGHAHMAL